jgi:putative endonuclease
MFYVYAIQSSSGNRIYIGHTEDLIERLDYHNSGYVKSTSRDRPWRLVACQEVKSRSEARWIEGMLKKSKGSRTRGGKERHRRIGYAPEGG